MRVNPGELIQTDHGRIASVLPNWQLFQAKLVLFFQDEQLLPGSLSHFGKTDAPYLLAYSHTAQAMSVLKKTLTNGSALKLTNNFLKAEYMLEQKGVAMFEILIL